MNSQTDIRLIQISDCHVPAKNRQTWYGRNPEHSLKNIITHINQYEPDNSLVLATGDLSHDGSVQSYRKLNALFAPLKRKIYPLTGNHDDLTSMNQYFHRYVSHLVLSDWLILMLDTQVSGQEYGLLSEQALRQAKQVLEHHTDNHVLIFMHHPPVPVGSAWIDKINLRNADDLFKLLDNYNNIKAISFGHVHQAHHIMHNTVSCFSCPSTCHQFLPYSDGFDVDNIDAGYRRFTLHADGLIESNVVRVASDVETE